MESSTSFFGQVHVQFKGESGLSLVVSSIGEIPVLTANSGTILFASVPFMGYQASMGQGWRKQGNKNVKT